MRSRLAPVALLGLILSTPAAAQEPAARGAPITRDSIARLRVAYERALRVAAPAWAVAERARVRADSLRLHRLPSDTVAVGPMRMLVDPMLQAKGQAALEDAWSRIEETFGRSATDGVRGRLFALRMRVDRPDRPDTALDIGEVRGRSLDMFDRVKPRDDADAIASRLARRVSATIVATADSEFVKWLELPLMPGAHPRLPERLYLDLATAPSQAVSRCFSGDLLRCREALLLTPVADPLTEWYAPAERRLIAQRFRNALRTPRTANAYDDCIERNVYVACDRLIRERIPRVPPPLAVDARHDLTRLALALGGPDAFGRLAAGTGRTPAQRLAAAARMPIDSVVAKWRDRLIEARPSRPLMSATSGWSAVLWGLALGVLSLGVFRWR